MITEKQIEANKNNAQHSTGPQDCSQTRFNAVRYGLTGDCVYSKDDELIVCNIYEDLCKTIAPVDIIEEVITSRIAKQIWRLQKINQVEEALFKNSLIKQRNAEKGYFGTLRRADLPPNAEEELMTEHMNTDFELINRYETTSENRLLKLIRFLYSKKIDFKQ